LTDYKRSELIVYLVIATPLGVWNCYLGGLSAFTADPVLVNTLLSDIEAPGIRLTFSVLHR